MTLGDHLRELRGRLVKSILAVVLFGVVGVVFNEQLLKLIIDPFQTAAEANGLDGGINYASVLDPFTVPLKIGLFTGVVLGAPVWLYQIWAFITPGLYRNERRWATGAVASAVPLFVAGIALCYWLLPRGLDVILGFTPEGAGVVNIVAFTEYFNFVLRLMLVFGVAFVLPVFVVLLNAVGVLSRETLSNARRWIVVGIFVFASVATPTGDPITMVMLAVPMWVLFESAVLICRFNDRRRARELGVDLDDDEASPLTPVHRDTADDLPSHLDDDVT